MDPENSLAVRLADSIKTVRLEEIIEEIKRLYESKDEEGIRKLYDSYMIGFGRFDSSRDSDEIRKIAYDNLISIANLAGYKNHANNNLIAQFVHKAVNPSSPLKNNGEFFLHFL